jgi:hypothetical protein
MEPDPARVLDIVSNLPPELLDQIGQYLPNQDLQALRAVNRHANEALDHQAVARAEEESWRGWLQGMLDQIDAVNTNAGEVLSPADFEQILEILEGFSREANRIPRSPQPRAPYDRLVELARDMKKLAGVGLRLT